MKIKLFLVISFVLSIVLVMSIIHLVGQNFELTKKEQYDSKLSLWILTPEIEQSLSNFQTDKNIKLKIKQFSDQAALLEAIDTAKMSGNLPDIVEMEANQLTESFYQAVQPKPFDAFTDEMLAEINDSILERFTYNDELYGLPLGMEVPVMLINNTVLKNQTFSPFNKNNNYEKLLMKQEDIQKQINKDDFWLFHTDENIPWLLNNFLTNEGQQDSFSDIWQKITNQYQLMPALEHEMAMTRFSNNEIGVLVTSSKNIRSVQPLVGNSFKMNVLALQENSEDKILVNGHALMVLNHLEESSTLLDYIQKGDLLDEILSKNGWLPVEDEKLADSTYMRKLPVSKYLNKLIADVDYFTGDIKLPKDNTEIEKISEIYLQIEQDEKDDR